MTVRQLGRESKEECGCVVCEVCEVVVKQGGDLQEYSSTIMAGSTTGCLGDG